MKFSEIEEKQWAELKPYLDTCLLPLTGLSGDEQPWQVKRALQRLKDVMDLVEIPFKGRVVTYPAMHFCGEDESFAHAVERTCQNLRAAGFRYVIVITADAAVAAMRFRQPDLSLFPILGEERADSEANRVRDAVQAMWRQDSSAM